jgi:hypothetical protein
MAQAGLAWLAGTDLASLPASVQADCLRGLERAGAMHTAARASALAAFTASAGYQDDGHGSARTWLKWQTQITGAAAAGIVGWMRRLAAHRAVGDALAAGQVSESFARCICQWSDLLPEASRDDADAILLAAAAGGAELAQLAALAEEMRRRTAGPDSDDDADGFDDRWVRLDEAFRGGGSLAGDLTAQCTAALRAVLDSLGRRRGPEDVRTKGQREHDALEEACRRLIAAGCLPDRAGQPTQIHLSMTLDQLRGLDAAAGAEGTRAARNDVGTGTGPAGTGTAWPGRTGPRGTWPGGTGPGGTGSAGPWPAATPWPAAGPGADCDAAIVPIVTGRVDRDLLDRLAVALADGTNRAAAQPGPGSAPGARPDPADLRAASRRARAERAAAQIILARAADLLSGPDGLAAYLRTRLPEDLAASVSLPLDIGAVTDTIPVHLRRAVAARDRGCRFPGCDQPAAACQPHHIVHRSEGGPTSLTNMTLLCSFHHLIAVHRWGWGITLHSDGTVTATSPDRSRVFHSHGPPATAA